jgi:uncharacterized repeat protein (TIGR01451 family)
MWPRLALGRLRVVSLLLFALSAATTHNCNAQQQSNRGLENQDIVVTLPPQQGVLRMHVMTPQEVRVNQSFRGQIAVTNVSKNLVFHDLTIGQRANGKLQIESSKLTFQQPNPSQVGAVNQQKNAQDSQDGASEKQSSNAHKSSNAQKEEQSKQSGGNGEKQSGSSLGNASGKFAKTWTIDRLGPGETCTIEFTASSSQQGDVDSCLALISMTPSVCLSTRFVKPELEIVKKGSDQANLCEPIVYQYFVKNAGTGDIERFTVHDKLADGLRTLEGKQELQFEVDGLKADEVRQFSAKLIATKAGEFSSRATASTGNGEEARSNSIATRVVAPQLAVAIDGPNALYIGRPATYTIRVTNQGEGPATVSRLVLRFPQTFGVAAVSEPMETERFVKLDGRAAEQTQRPTPAPRNETDKSSDAEEGDTATDKQSSQSETKESQSKAQRDQTAWDLGELAPGESRSMRITFEANRAASAQLEAEALAWCQRNGEELLVAKTAETLRAQVISLPALALAVVDTQDPVKVGDTVTYRVVVRNEGTADDKNIRVRVELPEGLKFVDATGATKGKVEGSQIAFEPVEELTAGEEVSWRVKCKAVGEGRIALRADLNSKGLRRGAKAEEPTTLFSEKSNGRSDQQDAKHQEAKQQEAKQQEEQKQDK